MRQKLSEILPFWDALTPAQQAMTADSILLKKLDKGTVLCHGGGECSGLEILKSGQARVFITSPNGGEITLYRLFPNDMCILSASCMIQNIDFEVQMEFEKDSEIWLIPQNVYKKTAFENPAVGRLNTELIADRLSNVMWVVNQLVFSNTGRRLADALLEQYALTGQTTLKVTHEKLANDLGTAREVVTRLLKQFQLDGMVTLSRGRIELTDIEKLKQI